MEDVVLAVAINGTEKGSLIEKYGVVKGDMLISVDGHVINDVLDYMFYIARPTVTLCIKQSERYLVLKLNKSEYDDIGLLFETFLMDKKQSCSNKCVFCFIDQMPPNMRETLYFKDDDARLSFLQGNYVTLTNMSDSDIDRIIEMRLNINVSVHTTNPELRCRMMNNRFAGDKLDYLRRLAEGRISMNCQIVLCPGLNDGAELERTLSDLGNLMPHVNSIAVVPVGLTKFRDGLFPLKSFDKASAEMAIDTIERYQADFLEKYGTRLVFPADELFIKAQREIPCGDYYEDYPQYENGVGIIRSLEDEFVRALKNSDGGTYKRRVSAVTGAAAYPYIKKLAEMLKEKYPEIECYVYEIANRFFGESITVAGLLTGGDLIEQLKGRELGDILLLPQVMIKRDSELFLDDITITELEKELDIKVKLVPNDGGELFEAFTCAT